MLVPLTMLAVAEIDSLPRGAASALDWFGVTTFLLFGAVLWIGWYAVLTGAPEIAAQWVQREIPGFTYGFRPVSVALAAALTLVWVVVVARSLRNNRRAIVNWAAGITMVWMLVMALGLPLIDQARSYRGMFASMMSAMPSSHLCIASAGLGDPQRALLDYFAGCAPTGKSHPKRAELRLFLEQGPCSQPAAPPEGFQEIWRGARPGDRSELFRPLPTRDAVARLSRQLDRARKCDERRRRHLSRRHRVRHLRAFDARGPDVTIERAQVARRPAAAGRRPASARAAPASRRNAARFPRSCAQARCEGSMRRSCPTGQVARWHCP